MGETITGEFATYQAYREAGMQYLEVLHRSGVTQTLLIQARNRFMSARNSWHMRTAQIDSRVAMMQLLARAA